MDNHSKSDFYLHSIMCLIGGFIGAYAILNRAGNLGSAQTSNLIYLVLFFLGRNMKEFLLRLLGVILYFSAIQIYVYITHKTKINVKRYAICVDIAGCFILSLIPASANSTVGLLPIFFMMSTQWSVFHGANGYNSSTIFSTNNLRQTALALGEYLCTKEPEPIKKVKFFANSLLWYHIGVAVSFFACHSFGIYASLFCIIPGCTALMITYKRSRYITFFMRRNTAA